MSFDSTNKREKGVKFGKMLYLRKGSHLSYSRNVVVRKSSRARRYEIRKWKAFPNRKNYKHLKKLRTKMGM